MPPARRGGAFVPGQRAAARVSEISRSTTNSTPNGSAPQDVDASVFAEQRRCVSRCPSKRAAAVLVQRRGLAARCARSQSSTASNPRATSSNAGVGPGQRSASTVSKRGSSVRRVARSRKR